MNAPLFGVPVSPSSRTVNESSGSTRGNSEIVFCRALAAGERPLDALLEPLLPLLGI
jgi:hypothetical protein